MATVIHAPLVKTLIDDREWLWYDITGFDSGGDKIDMLVVDGPPGNTQNVARYPAMPVLYDRLAGDCVVMLDDYNRKDEQQAVQMWKDKYSLRNVETLNLKKVLLLFLLADNNGFF